MCKACKELEYWVPCWDDQMILPWLAYETLESSSRAITVLNHFVHSTLYFFFLSILCLLLNSSTAILLQLLARTALNKKYWTKSQITALAKYSNRWPWPLISVKQIVAKVISKSFADIIEICLVWTSFICVTAFRSQVGPLTSQGQLKTEDCQTETVSMGPL